MSSETRWYIVKMVSSCCTEVVVVVEVVVTVEPVPALVEQSHHVSTL